MDDGIVSVVFQKHHMIKRRCQPQRRGQDIHVPEQLSISAFAGIQDARGYTTLEYARWALEHDKHAYMQDIVDLLENVPKDGCSSTLRIFAMSYKHSALVETHRRSLIILCIPPVPKSYRCPIYIEIVGDPVAIADGCVCDRWVLEVP